MRQRSLPTIREAAEILARKRSRPPPSGPPPAGRSLNKTLKDLDERFGQGPGALQVRWKEVVGPDLARRTEPVKLTKSRGGGPAALEIRVAGPAAALIQHQAPEIIARVNLFLGAGAVDKLRIVQGPLRGLVSAARALPRRTPPLDAAAEAELQTSLARAQDGPLKDALLKLGRGVLRNRPKP